MTLDTHDLGTKDALRLQAEEAGIDLHLAHHWDPAEELEMSHRVDRLGRASLGIRTIGHLTVVGPIVEPNQPVCAVCAEFWRRAWMRQHNEHYPVEGPLPGTRPVGPLASLVDIAASRLIDERQASEGDRQPTCWVVEPGGGMLRHRAHVDPACERCRPLRPGPGRGTITASPMNPETLRVSELPTTSAFRKALVDRRLGPIGHVWRDGRAPFGLVGADVALTNGAVGEAGYGRHEDLDRGERIAFAEAVERLCSAAPFSTENHVSASTAELGDSAVEVGALGLHSPATYERSDNEFVPYDPATETIWCPGSTLSGRSVFVPEHVAYWGLEGRFADRAPKFVFESSSGCATGGSLAEAVAYGLLEIIERDGFLLHWYRGASGTPVDFEHAPEWLVDARRIAASVEARIALFDQTTDIGIPVVTALVVRTDGRGPYAYVASGANLSHADAARSAVFEALTNAVMRARAPEPGLDESLVKAAGLLADPTQVESLRDHTLMYQHPDAAGRLAHLTGSETPVVAIESLAPFDVDRTDAANLAHRIGERVADATGHEIVYVDQTAAMAREVGLHVVKVVAPGTIPMTFGYWMARVDGLPRLDRIDVVGGTPGASSANAIERPHPFP